MAGYKYKGSTDMELLQEDDALQNRRKIARDIRKRDDKDIEADKKSFLPRSPMKKMAADDAKTRTNMDPTYTNSANRVADATASRKKLVGKYEEESRQAALARRKRNRTK